MKKVILWSMFTFLFSSAEAMEHLEKAVRWVQEIPYQTYLQSPYLWKAATVTSAFVVGFFVSEIKNWKKARANNDRENIKVLKKKFEKVRSEAIKETSNVVITIDHEILAQDIKKCVQKYYRKVLKWEIEECTREHCRKMLREVLCDEEDNIDAIKRSITETQLLVAQHIGQQRNASENVPAASAKRSNLKPRPPLGRSSSMGRLPIPTVSRQLTPRQMAFLNNPPHNTFPPRNRSHDNTRSQLPSDPPGRPGFVPPLNLTDIPPYRSPGSSLGSAPREDESDPGASGERGDASAPGTPQPLTPDCPGSRSLADSTCISKQSRGSSIIADFELLGGASPGTSDPGSLGSPVIFEPPSN